MTIQFRNYTNDTRFGEDYHKVCTFLKRINKGDVTTPNFLWSRWAWMISRPVDDEHLKNRIGIWEDQGCIVGLVTYELRFGEVFICVDRDYEFLKPEILGYARQNLSSEGHLKVMISDQDTPFQDIAIQHGFRATQAKQCVSLIKLTDDLDSRLPEGYRFVSLEKDWDFHQYNRVMWRGFGSQGEPNQEAEEILWRKTMLGSPHLKPELVVSVVAPDGNYVAHCGLWHNQGEDYAYVEPVATDPDYRKMGLGKAAVHEALKRGKQFGAQKAFVVSSQQFYYNIGFRPFATETWWESK